MVCDFRWAYQFYSPIPRRRDKEVFLDVGPVDRKGFSRVFSPLEDGKVLEVLAQLLSLREQDTSTPDAGCNTYIDHDVPQLDASVARGRNELVLVNL